jgi:hypothetical protein
MATNVMSLRKQWLGLGIMFATLHIAFVLNNGSTSDELSSIWNDFLRQQPKRDCEKLSAINVVQITSAVKLGQLLELPTELCFCGCHLGEFTVTVCSVHTVGALRKSLQHFDSLLTIDGDFLTDFLVTCRKLLIPPEKLPGVRRRGDYSSSLADEGPSFMTAVIKLLQSCDGNNDRCIAPILEWWEDILSISVIKDIQLSLAMIMSIDCHVKDDNHNPVIKKTRAQLFEKTKKVLSCNVLHMDLKALTLCVESIRDKRFPQELVIKYLRSDYEGLPEEKLVLSKPYFMDFLKTYYSRWPKLLKVEDQKCIIAFIFKASETYGKEQKLLFVEHLLELRQWPLVSASSRDGEGEGEVEVQKCFSDKLIMFIRASKLGTSVCGILLKVIKKTPHDFFPLELLVYEIIVEMVCCGILQHKELLCVNPPEDMLCVNVACSQLYAYYDSNPHLWADLPPIPLSWYWKIILRLSQELKPSMETFLKYEDQLTFATLIHGLYLKFSRKEAHRQISSESIQQQYLQWVSEVQNDLRQWKQRFEERKCSETDLEHLLKISTWNQKLKERLDVTNDILSEISIKGRIAEFQKVSGNICGLLLFNRKYSTLKVLRDYQVLIPPALQDGLEKVIDNITYFFDNPEGGTPKFRENAHLVMLNNLLEDLNKFLAPILPLLGFLMHFFPGNHFFMAFYEKGSKSCQPKQNEVVQIDEECSDDEDASNDLESRRASLGSPEEDHRFTMEVFCKILSGVELSLIRFLTGSISYEDLQYLIKAQGLEENDLELQFQVVARYPFREVTSDQIVHMGGIKDILCFQQFTGFLTLLEELCKLYGLSQCLNDVKMKEIFQYLSVLQSSEQMMQLTSKEAAEYISSIRRHLHLPRGSTGGQCIQLFDIVRQSENFVQFLRERKFYGALGARQFEQNVQLITANLQYEEFQENVLNNLRIAYEFVSPFLDPDIEMNDFLEQVHNVCGHDHNVVVAPFSQLKIANENIELIYLWFTRAEGNPLEELEHIIEHGYFEIPWKDVTFTHFPCNNYCQPHGEAKVLLKFPPTKKVIMEEEAEYKVVWLKEDIDDFIRQLGLLEKGKERDVQAFQKIFETAKKMLNTQQQLRKLGHQEMETLSLSCKCSLDEAAYKVQSLRSTLTSWEERLSSLDDQCQKLLLFSTQKFLRMYHIMQGITSTREMVDFLMKEMAISSSSYQDLTSIIDDAFQQSLSCSSHEERLLGTLTKVVHNFLPMQESPIPKDDHRNTRVILHLITCDTPQHLFDIALSILGPHPEAYQIFRCRPSTTIKEISRFFKRVETFWSLPFVIFAVTLLPPKVQEHLVHLHTKFLLRISVPFQLHYVASGSTILQDLPRVTVDNQTVHRGPELDQTRKLFLDTYAPVSKVTCLKLVHGKEGDGKSHFIQKMMTSDDHAQSVVITVNEAFSPLAAITELNKLDLKAKNAIHCNFTFLPAMEPCSTSQRLHLPKQFGPYSNHDSIAVEVDWFFFDLFYLHSVEDYESGQSFELPHKLNWTFYIEVPSCSSSKSSLEEFLDRYPLLKLIGCPEHVSSDIPYNVDASVQLVCKYLRAYELRDHPTRKKKEGIDKLLSKKDNKRSITFANLPDFTKESEKECHRLLQKYMKSHVRVNKLQQKLFIGYMKRRCVFMENFPHFNYNSDYPKLGSTIMGTMLDEVNKFCLTDRQREWSQSNLLQIVYEYTSKWDGGFLLLTVNHEALKEKLVDYRKIGIRIPHPSEIHTRKFLDRYLAAALNVPLDPDTKRIKLIDDKGYVLTLDYFLKMLEIHERMESGIPVIIEGETGVGKTALLEMLSLLWNASLMDEHRKFLERFSDELREISEKYSRSIPEERTDSFLALMEATTVKQMVPIEVIMQVCCCTLSCEDGEIINVASKLSSCMKKSTMDSSIALLEYESSWQEMQNSFKDQLPQELSFIQFWKQCIRSHETLRSESVAALLFCFLRAEPMQIFHKFSIHSALTPMDIGKFLKPILDQSNRLKYAWDMVAHEKVKANIPKVTVFFDEINTSSCPGLLKEILVDRTFQGDSVPENVFIVAACNPHRGNSIILEERKAISKVRTRTTYYVHPLHPTLLHLKWDYGALNEDQELLYVQQKMEMISKEIGCDDHGDLSYFAELIVCSQNLMRKYACEHMANFLALCPSDAKKFSYSCVSQRDIQRVFIFLNWLMNCYQSESFKDRFERNVTLAEKFETAVSLSLALVYYVRLDDNPNTNGNGPLSYRSQYVIDLQERTGQSLYINTALKQELMFYGKRLCIPPGVAKTRVLLENMFCIIACCCTRTPLIITGPPGSSKTLSFSLTLDNIKGRQSTLDPFKNFELFPSLDPHYYQCSVQTTSTEVETVFQRAINRQRRFNGAGLPINCVVFMDEAGLPEESHESLKVLHKYLDSKEVAFVAISNHPLDAAKTNRAVSLYRATYTKKDIKTLAKECLGAKERSNATLIVERLCEPYDTWMNSKTEFSKFFGLRDFIHLIHYLRRTELPEITPQLVMEALERNFNGYHKFEDICRSFLKQMQSAPEKVQRRSIVDILRNSLGDQPKRSLQKDQETYDEVRYKLIIDPSEDGSVSRLLTMYKVLDPEQTRIFICSEFPEDSHLQKVNTIAAIRHAAEEGKTVLMSQTDDIHESFYDLFNQHFRRIDNPDPTKEPKFYANIAIGSHHKPCRVHKDFQCVVIIKESEVKDTPAPFLNRFEKYRVSHKDFLRARLDSFPPCMRIAVNAALEKVKDFFDHVGEDSFYGARRDDTVGSIALSILPKSVFRFKHSKVARQRSSHNFRGRLGVPPDSPKPQTARTSSTVLLSFLIDELTKSAGFVIPEYSEAELKSDAAYIVRLLGKARSSLQGVARAIQENKYSDSDLRDFVKETLQHLHNPSGPDLFKTPYGYAQIRGISSESCFVVMVFVQWLVQYMCKHLLQLMTAEALTLHRKQIPLWCLNTYLRHQSHFCLKNLIERNLGILQSRPQAGTVSTKLVCFTRFTPDINQLPSVLPPDALPLSSSTVDARMIETMQKMICEEPYNVYLCKLSNITSEQAFRNYLKSFKDSIAKVMVLVINMQETKKQMVNHIRIMVEQAEGSPRNPKKLFVLLLHFPPSMFYDCCYPALFLNGWDHHYFDSLQPELEGVVDIRLWFTVACQRDKASESHTIVHDAAQNMMRDTGTVNIIASRVAIGSKNGGEFNSTPRNGNEILTRFQKLLESPVGDVLCDMYAKYWKPSEMARYLEEAASYARNRKSTLSMTDSVGDFFQTAFHNFLAYMINMMNEGLNLDNVYKVVAGGEGGSDMERIKKDLFLQMMLCLPTPDLNQLKDYSYNWSVQSTTVTRTFFPFFVSISSIVDRLLDESKKRIQEKKHRESLTTVLELKVHDIDPMSMSEELLELLKNPKLLPTSDNSLLCCAVQAIKEHPELWDVYWRDFHVTRFHINIQEDAQLAGYPQEKPACTDSAIACLAKLHCSAAAAGLSGCKHLLLDLNPLTVLKQNILKSALPPKLPNPVSCLNEATQSGSPSELARFIIDFLFRSLAFGCLKWGSTLDTDDLFLFWSWRNAYRDVTSQSRVTEILFKSPEVTELNRVEMTVMAAVYLLLQTRKTLDEEISKLAFDFGSRMVFKFFSPKEPLQLRVPVLHVEDVMDRYQAAYQYDRPHRYTEEDDVTFRENLLTYFFAVEVDKRDEKDIVWFLNHVNALPSSHNDSHKSGSVSDGSTNPFHGLSQEVIGHMLGMILTPHTSSEDLAVPLEIFHHQTRKLVGAELMRTAVPGEVGPYVPPVYRNMLRISATADPRMTQLLADLYFNSTLEQLERVTPKETSFVAVIGDLQNVLKHIQNSFLIPELQILLRIELQAMMQMLLKKVAQGLADKQQQQNVIDSAIGIEDYIEGTIMDCNSDGREAAGHKLVLMKHLYKDLQGPGNLIVFLTQFDQSDGGLHFFESYKSQLNLHYLEVAIQFPFATGPKGRPRGYVEIELDKVYFELYMCIMEANKKGDFESSSHLLEWLKHCVQTQPTLTCGPGNPEINTKCFLRMSIWLIVYELYNIIKSPNLIETLCERIDFLDFTEQHQMVLRTFLKRSEMERNKRSETPLQEDMERILGRERRQEFSETDPLFDLFMKPSSEENDSTEESFRNALANLLAVVFSLPSESTHLWYLFHDPTKLRDTFLPGFMYPHKVNKDKMLYDCGILLNEDGEFGRPDYRDHDSGLSLHSFYLVTWSTIGTLCMSLLTNPQAQEAVHGHLISDWQPLRHFCLQQLRHIWLSMQTNLELNNEERDFFFVEAMLALFKKGQSVNKPPGVFHSQEDVFQYERMWHKDIYQSTMCGYRDQMLKRLTFLRDYIYCQFNELDSQYPQFPSEKQLKNNLVSVQDCSEEPKHTVLLKFLEDRHRLAVGSALLPDLVEFYLWLDVHLAHLIRYEVAQTLSVGQLMRSACERYPSEAARLKELFARMKENFNQYIKLHGGVLGAGGCHRRRHDEVITAISDETPVINFLSTKRGSVQKDQDEENEANDWIFLTIRDIATVHNNLIDRADSSLYICWMQSKVEKVDVREFSSQLDGVFSGNNKWLLSLIQSRYIPVESLTRPEVSLTSIQHTRSQPMFDLSKLESDIVRYFIAGKRTIEVGTLWKPFRFKSSKVGHTSVPASLTGPGVPVDLAALSQELPSCCKVELYCDERKQWETHFHNVSYGTLSDLVTCLKSSCGYMYKSFQRVGEEILEKDLMEYLRSYFDDEESSHASKEIFSKLGLDVKCLKPEQLETLEKVKMRNLFRTLEMFVGWIGDCLFDFHMLPFSVKTPLPSEVAEAIQRASSTQGKYYGVEKLEGTVSHLAHMFGSEGVKPTQTLRECLTELQFYEEKDLPSLDLLPMEVQIQHYVYYIVLLRRLKLELKRDAATVEGQNDHHTQKTQWSEMVPDMWKRLPHFQDNFKDLLLPVEDFVFDLGSFVYPIQLDDDNVTSEGTGSEIWLDKAPSIDPFQEPQETSMSIVVIDNVEEDEHTNSVRVSESPPLVRQPMPSEPSASNQPISSQPAIIEPIPSQPTTKEANSSQPVPSVPTASKLGQSPDIEGASIMPSMTTSVKPPSEKALNMTVEEVVQWLDTIKLGQLAEAFRSEEVDGALLATYDLKDLEDIGIELNKDRKKILVKFRQI